MNSMYFVDNNLAGLFFIAVVAAVIIAYGIQFILSSLSLAVGLSLTPNLKEVSTQSRIKSLTDGDSEDLDDDEDSVSAASVTSGVGVWVLLTASVALFIGSYLGASMLPLVHDYAVLVGLVIWALFFISLVVLEYRAVSSLIGSLITMALSGIRSSASAVSSIVAPSPQAQIKSSVRSIYEEVDDVIRKENVESRLTKFLNKVTPDLPELKDVRKEIEKLINRIEVEEKTHISDEDFEKELNIVINKHPNMSKDNAKRLVSSAKAMRSNSDKSDSMAGKLAAVIDHIAPVSDDTSKKYRQRLADVLNNTSEDELDASKFIDDIDKAFDDPQSSADSIIARLKMFDKKAIEEVVSGVSNMDRERSKKLVDVIAGRIENLTNKNAQNYRDSFKPNASISEKLNTSLTAFFDGSSDPALNYPSLKRDIQLILEEPSKAPQMFRKNLALLDKQTVVELLEGNSNLSHSQAQQLADTVLDAKESALGTLDKVNAEASRRIQHSRRKATLYAEHTRKASIAASWWLFASAIVSAVASIGGVMVTLA